jgi:hypothetical protein
MTIVSCFTDNICEINSFVISFYYLPFPNIYPVVGASAGAILSPADKIPVKFDDLDPCHNNSINHI